MPKSRKWPAVGGVLAGVSALVVLAYLVAGDDEPGPSTTTSTTNGATTSTTTSEAPPVTGAPPNGIKPVIQGLIANRDRVPARSHWGVVEGFVVDATWADLQPEPGGPVAPDNVIDQAVAEVRDLAKNGGPATMALKVRVRGGIFAPEWAKAMDGAPIAVVDDENRGTVGRFWTEAYGRAYADLQARLASRYDQVPEIAQAEISRCTTFYAEPFLRQFGDPETQANLLAAGYTAAADVTCQRQQIEAHQVWGRTRSGLMLNPYQRINPDATVTPDVSVTMAMMDHCRAVLGPRCVLQNASIRFPQQDGKGYAEMYRAISARGAPIAFQTAAPARIGDPRQTLLEAASAGANSVELNRSYPTYDLAELRQARERLRANRT
jgi:hypothetical protein